MNRETVSSMRLYSERSEESLISMTPSARPPAMGQLLYRHALGEIARFIDVAAEFYGEMICQKLEWDDGENRHHVIRRFRQHDDLVRNSFQMLRAVAACQRNDRAFASFNLLDVVQVF